jgi:plasmid maintenance system antidote protein VapI
MYDKSSTIVSTDTIGKGMCAATLLLVSDFTDFLASAARKFKTKQEFAAAVGITAGRFSRLLRGEFSMEVVNCLRLAKVSGESPAKVLRLAGKSEIVDLIDELYARQPLTQAQRELIEVWDAIPAEARAAFGTMLRYTREVAATSGPSARSEGHSETHRRRRTGATRTRATRREDAKT